MQKQILRATISTLTNYFNISLRCIHKIYLSLVSLKKHQACARPIFYEGSRSPLVSIIIPCYNYGEFVAEAVDSALNQTLSDIEVIIVDDGSTDLRTKQILDTFSRLKTSILRSHNRGVSGARNWGILHAKGKYICCLDADDKLHPTYLEKCVTLLESRRDSGFAYSFAQLFGDEDLLWRTEPFDLRKSLNENLTCTSAVFRRAAWEIAGGYSEAMRSGYEDWEFWLRLGWHGMNGLMIPEPLFFYRRHGQTLNYEAQAIHDTLVNQIKSLNPEIFSAENLNNYAQPLNVLSRRPFDWLKTELNKQQSSIRVQILTYNKIKSLESILDKLKMQNLAASESSEIITFGRLSSKHINRLFSLHPRIFIVNHLTQNDQQALEYTLARLSYPGTSLCFVITEIIDERLLFLLSSIPPTKKLVIIPIAQEAKQKAVQQLPKLRAINSSIKLLDFDTLIADNL